MRFSTLLLRRADLWMTIVATMAAVQAHPAWMVERWIEFYGADAMHAICRHGQSQPRLTVRMENPAIEDELSEAGIELACGELLTAARTVVSGDVTATAAFREGRARVQDEGSQLIGEFAAFPGKDLGQNQTERFSMLARRLAAKRSFSPNEIPRRASSLANRASSGLPTCANVSPHTPIAWSADLADAAGLEEEAAFDLALVDVPCSGTGTLGRNPEIRHRLQLEDLPRLAERQRAILRAALRAVRPGGRVVYSTCSLEPEENEQVVAAVLAENPNARQISLAPAIEALQRNGILRPEATERLQNMPHA